MNSGGREDIHFYATALLHNKLKSIHYTRQQLGKNVPVATNMRVSIDELLEAVFSMRSLPKLYKKGQ
jgi:hypothetical protein